jgi:peptidoglycan/LPS O-acetylase OafA/YrhL
MIISINDPIQQTGIFSIIFFIVLLISAHRRQITDWFPASLTTELKGLAILMIILSHIGYFLVSDHRFLWPLSIAAGVGVNLFLFLSGFGLTASQLQKNLSIWQFYKRRLLKLFTPFWLVLVIFLILDFFLLKINYSWDYIGRAFLGIFTHADLYADINSPLWYFTFILGYYLLFPLVFFKRWPWLSALALYAVGYLVIYFKPIQLDYVLYLYKVHIIAFPLGVLAAWIVSKLKRPEILEKLSRGWSAFGYYLMIAVLLGTFIYANINSGIGGSARLEQGMSVLAILAISGVFILKKAEFRLLSLFGLYSYEIYLFHWPLMYRYDIFYFWLPAWLATLLYLVLFIGLGWGMNKIISLAARKPVIINK